MTDVRTHRARKNIVVSLGCQLVTLLCGIIVPQLLIRAFGSEVFGATVSIGQFLSYITLLEGGLGGVARAALYRPLADGDDNEISHVMAEIRRFFRTIACVFLLYVLVIACSFNAISGTTVLDWATTFVLVLVISLSTFSQYYIGLPNTILLQAAQKSYVTNTVQIAGTVANTIMIVALVALRCDIIVVKLVSSVVFALKPVALWLYVRRHYRLHSVPRSTTQHVTQKWSGISQHIAFFLHSNTDVVVLTCFANLKLVAVYSVYHMIVGNMQNLVASFVTGMEAMFGDMLAKKEAKQLNETFELYETILSVASVVLFSVTAVAIVPFVKIYAAGVTDANYEAPLFACLLTVSALVYCLRMPYHSMVIAAGHFKRTQLAAYGEAAINVLLSIALVFKFELAGVAFATLVATSARLIYYAIYLSRNILERKIGRFIKRTVLNAVVFVAVAAIGKGITELFTISNYGIWALYGLAVTLAAILLTLSANLLVYRHNCQAMLSFWKNKR